MSLHDGVEDIGKNHHCEPLGVLPEVSRTRPTARRIQQKQKHTCLLCIRIALIKGVNTNTTPNRTGQTGREYQVLMCQQPGQRRNVPLTLLGSTPWSSFFHFDDTVQISEKMGEKTG